MSYFTDERAIVETAFIGQGTRIGAFSHILAGARIGNDCDVGEYTLIESDVVMGDRVSIDCGVQLWNGTAIEDDVFIGANATLARGNSPRSRQQPDPNLRTVIKRGASIGANATILPGLVIGEHATIEAGAVLTKNAPPNAILTGNPARIEGYAGLARPAVRPAPYREETGASKTSVEGVMIHRLPLVDDLRGTLSFAEVPRHVPFEIKRYFVVFEVSSERVRGEHAHRRLHQFVTCVHGRCQVVADDGSHREEFVLDNPAKGVYIPPMVWSTQYKHSSDAVLLVLASDYYDPSDYIRDYSEFLAAVQERQAAAGRKAE